MSWEAARTAYPLVRLHDAAITLDTWLGFARRHCRASSERAGLIALRDCRGIIHALFSYRVDLDLQARKRLCVANLIVAHLPGSPIEQAVDATARNVSAQFGCQSITIEQPFRFGPPCAADARRRERSEATAMVRPDARSPARVVCNAVDLDQCARPRVPHQWVHDLAQTQARYRRHPHDQAFDRRDGRTACVRTAPAAADRHRHGRKPDAEPSRRQEPR